MINILTNKYKISIEKPINREKMECIIIMEINPIGFIQPLPASVEEAIALLK